MQEIETERRVSRRGIVVGALWTVPAVVATSALPAYAASTTRAIVRVDSFTAPTGGQTATLNVLFDTNDTSKLLPGTTGTVSVSFSGWTGNADLDPIAVATGATTYTLDKSSVKNLSANGTFTIKITLGTVNASSLLATLSITMAKGKSFTAGSATATGATVPTGTSNGTIKADGNSVTLQIS